MIYDIDVMRGLPSVELFVTLGLLREGIAVLFKCFSIPLNDLIWEIIRVWPQIKFAIMF